MGIFLLLLWREKVNRLRCISHRARRVSKVVRYVPCLRGGLCEHFVEVLLFTLLTNPKPYARLPVALTGSMSFFLDYLWIWVVLTFVIGISGGAWYLNDQKWRNLIIAVLAPIITLAIGLTLYYGVDTDRKSIARILNALIAAIERDDIKTVHGLITERAADVRKLAEQGLETVSITKAKYHNLAIEINDAASPPVARVSFDAVFYWRNKHSTEGVTIQPIPERTQFAIELVKTKDRSWLVNKCPPPRMRFQ